MPAKVVAFARRLRIAQHRLMKNLVQLMTVITQPATASRLERPVILLLLSFAAGLAFMQPCAATPGEWNYTGSLETARFRHTATLLSDGRVLVAGGGAGQNGPLASAELYDPATGIFSDTASLNSARDSHTATLLPDGKVLVAGGFDASGYLASAELYDPATGTWLATGSFKPGRAYHTATLLPNGMVLVAGGGLHGLPLASAELYDPGIVAATRVDGHGTINNLGDRITFHLRATESAETNSADYFSFCDPLASVCLTNAGIRSLSINGNTAACSGTARLDDGTKVSFTVNVTDNGSPGTMDTISITLNDGYFVDGTLTSGDIQIY